MAISRLTLSASLINIVGQAGESFGDYGGGEPHETIYSMRQSCIQKSIFYPVIIIDQFGDIGGGPEGVIATDLVVASLNAEASSPDFISDVGGPADPANTFPFRVELNGVPIDNSYVKYVETSGVNTPGDRYYAVGVVADGEDIIRAAVTNGVPDTFSDVQAASDGRVFKIKVFYKFYDGEDFVWAQRPIQIFHDIQNKPDVGNIVGYNKGTFGIPYSNIYPSTVLANNRSAGITPLQAGLKRVGGSPHDFMSGIEWHFPKPLSSQGNFTTINNQQPYATHNPANGFADTSGGNYNNQVYRGNLPYADYLLNYNTNGVPTWDMLSGGAGVDGAGPWNFALYTGENWPNSMTILNTANSPIGAGFSSLADPENIVGWVPPQVFSQSSGYGATLDSFDFFDGMDTDGDGILTGASEGDPIGSGNWIPNFDYNNPTVIANNMPNSFFNENWVTKQSEFILMFTASVDPVGLQKLYTPYNSNTLGNAGGVGPSENISAVGNSLSRLLSMASVYFSFSDASSPPGDPVQGCTDPLSCNYNPSANIEDGSCEYPNFDLDYSEFAFGEIITLESGAGTTLITDTFFEISFGNQADTAGDDEWPSNNPFYDNTGQKNDVRATITFTPNGGAPVNYQFTIQTNNAGTTFTAYSLAGVDGNVTVTLEGGSFGYESLGGTIRISVSNLAFNVPEEVQNNQVSILFSELTNSNNGAAIDGDSENLYLTGCIKTDSINVEVGSSEIQGCTDDTAFNFVPEATDGNPLSASCIYCNTDATNVLTLASVSVAIPNSEYMGLGLEVGDNYFGDLVIDLNFGEAAWYTSGTFKVIMFTAAGSLDFDAQLAAYLTAASTSSALPASVLHEITLEGVDVGPLSAGYTIIVPGPDSGIPVNSSTDLAGYRSVIIPIDPDTGYHYHNTCLVESTTYFPGYICDDDSIGITNYGGPASPPLTLANNDLCISSTNCADYDVQGSVDFIQTDLYTGTDGETVACSGYFNISVSGPEGMMYAVKVSSNTGSFSNHYLSGQNISGIDYIFNYIPNSPEGEFGATTITFTLAQLSELTGSPYAYGDYNFEFLFYLGTVFDPSLPISTVLTNGQAIINNPATLPCTVEYTYSLTEDNVQICGCTIQDAENYNPQATYNIVEMCGQIPGCTDPTALNYYNIATVEDGSCIYPIPVCVDPDAINYVNEVVYPQYADNTLCEFIVILGCTDPEANNFNPVASIDNGTCLYDGEDFDDEDIVDVGISDFENFLLYLQHCLQYKGEKYFSALLTGKTVDEDRYLHLSMINDLLSSKGAACLFDGTDAANARLKEFIKIALTYCEDCRERSGVLKAPYSQTQQGLYMPGSTTYNSDVLNVLNLGGAGNISLGGGGSLTGGSEGVDE